MQICAFMQNIKKKNIAIAMAISRSFIRHKCLNKTKSVLLSLIEAKHFLKMLNYGK